MLGAILRLFAYTYIYIYIYHTCMCMCMCMCMHCLYVRVRIRIGQLITKAFFRSQQSFFLLFILCPYVPFIHALLVLSVLPFFFLNLYMHRVSI